MEYSIFKGGHADLKRIYPLIEFKFGGETLPSERRLHRGMHNGAELLLLKNERGYEAGFSYCLKKPFCPYILLGWHALYPTTSDEGVGDGFLRLIKEYYGEKPRSLLVVVEGCPGTIRGEGREIFYERNGFARVPGEFNIGGAPARLLCSPPPVKFDLVSTLPETVLFDLLSALAGKSELKRVYKIIPGREQ